MSARGGGPRRAGPQDGLPAPAAVAPEAGVSPRARQCTSFEIRSSREDRVPSRKSTSSACAASRRASVDIASLPFRARFRRDRMSTVTSSETNPTFSRSAMIRRQPGSSTSGRSRLKLERSAPRGSSGTGQSRADSRSRLCGRAVTARYASSARVFFDGGSCIAAPSRTTARLPNTETCSNSCLDDSGVFGFAGGPAHARPHKFQRKYPIFPR